MIFTLVVSGAAGAQKLDNLRPWQGEDFCSISISQITIDGKEDLEYEKTVNESLKKSNILYGNPINADLFSPECVLINYFTVNATREPRGGYVYVINYKTVTVNKIMMTLEFINNPNNYSKQIILPWSATIWMTGNFGLSSGLDDLKATIIDYSKKEFEDFLLDWRTTHPSK